MNEKRFQICIAILLSGLLAGPTVTSGFRADAVLHLNNGQGIVNGLTHAYRPHPVATVSFAIPPRLEKLMRAGVIYLSLRDAIALALENNLDIEVARYYPKLALSDLQRASAGQLLRNVSTSLSQGPSSASLNVLAGASQVNAAGTASSSSGNSSVLSGLSVQLAGASHSEYRNRTLTLPEVFITPPASRPPRSSPARRFWFAVQEPDLRRTGGLLDGHHGFTRFEQRLRI